MIMADLIPLTAKDHRTIVVVTIEVVEKIERIHQTQTFDHTPQQRTESWGTKN